jgi:hypothetical protein
MTIVIASVETSCYTCIWPIKKGEMYYKVDGHPVCKHCVNKKESKV